MSEDESLLKLHAEIMVASRGYQLPWSLLTLVDDEYLSYIRNMDGGGLYYQWLALAVRITKPALVLELGSGLGVSALMMLAELLEKARLISCDVARDLKFVPETARNDPRIRFCCGNDLDLNIFGNELPIGIDLLFIDTEHTFKQISAEWNIYRHLCSPGALVVLDDIRMNDMPRFWESLPYPKFELTEECHSSGFGIFRYETDQRPSPVTAYREALRIVFERHNPEEGGRLERGVSTRSNWRRLAKGFLPK